ncbi:MAG: ABC transporter substrate-binding protein [Clostridiales bacterium]|nr:ABC transporter substrate-binding protein [Clostridiales bacterium]
MKMTMKKNSLIVLLLALMLALTACGGDTTPSAVPDSNAASTATSTVAATAGTATTADATAATAEATGAAASESAPAALPTEDRAGNPITVPSEIKTIVSMSPATTQLLETFGMLNMLVAVDTQSPMYTQGISGLPQYDMMKPDVEALTALNPDIVFVSGMSSADSENPFKALIDAGICVVTIPSSSSIAGVEEDITFTAACLGKSAEGKKVVDDMQAEIDKIAAIGATITEKKTVMFEISALPSIYSFGKGTFLDEMINIIGAKNTFGDQEGWLPVTEEAAIAANPDVIITNVNYIEDSVAEILSRKGWENMKAVSGKNVYYVDNGKSSIPNQHIVEALKEIAAVVYPDKYKDLK